MPTNISHFAVQADEVERARTFYEDAFGWTFAQWGPPDFYQIRTGTDDDPGVRGALERRHNPAGDAPLQAYVCTISVDDVDAAAKGIKAAGGKIVYPKYHIPNVGWLVQFVDTEGNVATAMQYEAE